MKKIISFILLILIITSTFTVPTSATSQSVNEKYVEQFEYYLNEHGVNTDDGYVYEELYEYYSKYSDSSEPEYVLARGGTTNPAPGTASGVFGDYYIYEDWYHSPYPLGYYVYIPQDGKFYTLEFVYNNYYSCDNAFSEYLVPQGIAQKIEDIDLDGKITLADTENLEKGIYNYNSHKKRLRIFFDGHTVDWKDYEKIYCSVTKADGKPIYKDYSTKSLCSNFWLPERWEYDLFDLAYMVENDTPLSIRFYNENGDTTDTISVNKSNIGGWVFCYDKSEDGTSLIRWFDENSMEDNIARYDSIQGKKAGTNRYYFLMPDGTNGDKSDDKTKYHYGKYPPSWYYTGEGGPDIIWDGEFLDEPWDAYFSTGRPDYPMKEHDCDEVYYSDVPKTVEYIQFYNAKPEYVDPGLGKETISHIETDGYAPGESDIYPNGIECFDEMIYVIDLDIHVEELSIYETFGGEWYYYYGDGCYGTNKYGKYNCDAYCIRDDHNHLGERKSLKQLTKEYEERNDEKLTTYRYYFLMPNGENGIYHIDDSYQYPETTKEELIQSGVGSFASSWFNERTDIPSVCSVDELIFETDAPPGNTMERTDQSDVFYADIPDEIQLVMINNSIPAGYPSDSYLYDLKKSTDYVSLGDRINGKFEYYDNMIFVIDPVYEIEYGERYVNGKWFYYYGAGCYGTDENGQAITNCVRDDHFDLDGNHIKVKHILGDVDGDGEVSIMDATEIQMVIAQLLPSLEDITVADVDGDGEVSIMDATAIQMQLAKLG